MHGNISMEKNEWKVAEDETIIVDPSDRPKVLMAVSTAAMLLGADVDEGAFWQTVTYDLNSVLDGESSIFISNSVSNDQWKSSRWISDHQLVYWDTSGGLNVFRAAANQSVVLVPAHVVSQWRTDEYWPSYDGRYVLLRQYSEDSHNSGELFHGFNRREDFYAVYDTLENDLWKIRLKANDLQPTLLEYVGWSGRSSHLLAIHHNRIYWSSDATSLMGWRPLGGVETDYEEDYVFNGMPDWTYSEGVIRWQNLMWPNIGGDWLLYATLNSSRCSRLDFIEYLVDHSQARNIRHAVPGGQLPEIQLKLIHLESDTETPLAISQLANLRQWILVQVEWLDETGFITAWMTRNQNETRVFHCQVNETQCDQIIIEKAVPDHWLAPLIVYPSPSGNGFIMVLETDQVQDGQRLVYHRPPWHKTVSIDLSQLTVKRIVGWNETTGTTYLLCSPSDEPHTQNLYRVVGSTTECLSCDLPADNCNYVDGKFEQDNTDFYELKCLGPHIPSVHVFQSESNEMVATLQQVQSEGDLRDLLEHLTPSVKHLTIPLENGGVGRVQLLLPRSWNDKSYNRLRFPLVIQTLDWDEEDTLTDQWRKDWPSYFCLTRQVIYARVSGRESAGQYGSLQAATDDLITIVKYLMAEVKHVETQAVILIGKGVGGYLTTMMMAKDNEDIFKCGVVVSPITDWFRYEASVAERFLGSVVDQQEHYVLSKTDNHINLIKNDTLLLVDSFPFNPVQHLQSIRFSNQMIDAGIRFEHKTYFQSSRKVLYHFYLSLENFITHCL